VIRYAVVVVVGAAIVLALEWPRHRVAGADDALAAEATIREYLAFVQGVAASPRTPGLADRVPATPRLIHEAMTEAAYAREVLGLVEAPELVRVDPIASRLRDDGVLEVTSREYWIYRRQRVGAGGESLPTVSAVVRSVHEVGREGRRWVVLDYRLEPFAREGGG